MMINKYRSTHHFDIMRYNLAADDAMFILPNFNNNKLYTVSYLDNITCEQLFYLDNCVMLVGKAVYFFVHLPAEM